MDVGQTVLMFYGAAAAIVGGSIFVIHRIESFDWANWRVEKPEPSGELASGDRSNGGEGTQVT
jgi:hypothetical protein